MNIPGLAEAVGVLAGAESVALACHVGPDGDALGSMLAMAHVLAGRGVDVSPSFGEPFTIPDAYRFLPVDLLVAPSEVPEHPKVMVSFDAGSLDRLGALVGPATAADSLVVIDHHVTNTGFGHLNLIVPEAAATAEIVYHLLVAAGWEIDPVTATCLHTGIVTDTGRFQYSNTTPATLEVAAALVSAGARPELVGRHVYEEAPFGYLKVEGRVMERAVLEPERRLVWSVLQADDLKETGIGLDDTDMLIDTLRVARESDVALLVKEFGPDRVKGSLRSRGRVDVGEIAVALGGGGHHNAAGFTYAGTAEAAVAEVRARLEVVA